MEILSKQFENIKQVYYYSLQLGKIDTTTYDKDMTKVKLALGIIREKNMDRTHSHSDRLSLDNHYERILNFFLNRTTNAAAEAFNAKTKVFRTSFRGIADRRFFLFRLAKVYA